MVKNPGTEARAHQLRPLNNPCPIQVATCGDLPVALFDKRGERLEIATIEERWRIDDEWWREQITRHYYAVRLETGPLHSIYFDVPASTWYEQRY